MSEEQAINEKEEEFRLAGEQTLESLREILMEAAPTIAKALAAEKENLNSAEDEYESARGANDKKRLTASLKALRTALRNFHATARACFALMRLLIGAENQDAKKMAKQVSGFFRELWKDDSRLEAQKKLFAAYSHSRDGPADGINDLDGEGVTVGDIDGDGDDDNGGVSNVSGGVDIDNDDDNGGAGNAGVVDIDDNEGEFGKTTD